MQLRYLSHDGLWRSLVARLTGGQEVESSSLSSPTNKAPAHAGVSPRQPEMSMTPRKPRVREQSSSMRRRDSRRRPRRDPRRDVRTSRRVTWIEGCPSRRRIPVGCSPWAIGMSAGGVAEIVKPERLIDRGAHRREPISSAEVGAAKRSAFWSGAQEPVRPPPATGRGESPARRRGISAAPPGVVLGPSSVAIASQGGERAGDARPGLWPWRFRQHLCRGGRVWVGVHILTLSLLQTVLL